MKNEQLVREFNDLDLIKVFEIEVINKLTSESDYILFDISADNEGLKAQHVGLTEAEEKSNKIAFKSFDWDEDFDLDYTLQTLHEICLNAIIDSDNYRLV